MRSILRMVRSIPWAIWKPTRTGRLVLGGYGKACAWKQTATSYYQLASNVDNDGWFDDTSDGPVSAVVVLDGGNGR